MGACGTSEGSGGSQHARWAIIYPACDCVPPILQSPPDPWPSPLGATCRLTYSSYRPYAKRFRQIQADHKQEAAAAGGGADGGGLGGETALALSLPEAVVGLDPEADDAFATLMGWLYSRIDATR